jgi:hypothetical protein
VPALLLLAVLAAGLSACGGGSKPPQRPNATTLQSSVVDPKPRESINDVIARIEGATTATGCDPIKGLLHSSYGEISDVACRAVQAELGAFRSPAGKAFKTGAAIAYDTGAGQHRAVVLALDADGTYRVDFVEDLSAAAGSVDGTKAPGFDRNAAAVVTAMQAGDCDSFLRLVDRSIGLGVGGDERVCKRLSDVPFRRELLSNRTARPVALGGNGFVAFYKLRTTPTSYYTLVMTRAEPAKGSAGSPRYVLVNALPA